MTEDPFVGLAQPSFQSETWPTEEYPPAFPAVQAVDDSSSASDTSSDDGNEVLDGPDTSQMTEADAAEAVFYRYRQARRAWRRFTGKPVRRFRRNFKKTLRGYGRGQRKGRGRGFFYTQDEVFAFLKGKGKGNRSHTSGKGHGRRKNPRDRNGDIMKCSICGSEDHFRANCPQGKGKGNGSKGGGFQPASSPST